MSGIVSEVASALYQQVNFSPRFSNAVDGEVQMRTPWISPDSSGGYFRLTKTGRRDMSLVFCYEIDETAILALRDKTSLVKYVAVKLENAVFDIEYQWAAYWTSDLWC